MKRRLVLAVKREYFEAIKSGEKVEEYRAIGGRWDKRMRNVYDEVWITLGYPRHDQADRWLGFKWAGVEVKSITHELFGPTPVDVYAIKLTEPLCPSNHVSF
jgi:hypothetical protein